MKLKFIPFLFAHFLCVYFPVYANDNNYIDSLKQALLSEKKVDQQLLIYNHLCKKFIELSDFDQVIYYGQKGVAIASKNNEAKWLDNIFNKLVYAYYYKADWSNMLKSSLDVLKIQEVLKYETGKANCYNSIGTLYQWGIKDYNKSIFNYLKALRIFQHLDSVNQVGSCFINIGANYDNINEHNKALGYFKSGIKIKRNFNDSINLAIAIQSLGGVYINLNEIQNALNCFEEAGEIFKRLQDDLGVATIYCNKGDAYLKINDYSKARENFEKSDVLAETIGDMDLKRNIYQGLSKVNAFQKNFEAAYNFHVQFKDINDSMFNENKNNQLSDITTSYENEKKLQQIKQLNLEKKQQIELASKEKKIRYVFVVAFIFMLGLAFVIYRSYRQKQKANGILDRQKREIELINSEIHQSITYAKRIQSSILPPINEIELAFQQSFVLFLPKDIVSGDFYWFYETEQFYFISAADCTGHGVPGSLMSMLGSQVLNDAIVVTQEPKEILKLVNQGIKKALRQTAEEDSTRDGMDIALCRFDKQNKRVVYAGANRPLVLIRQNEIIEYKATKSAIGGLTDVEQEFEEHVIDTLLNDTLYMFTDGFADQFGGSFLPNTTDGKKLKTKNLKEKLLAINSYPMNKQMQYLSQFFEEWKGSLEQTDDVLVIGIRI